MPFSALQLALNRRATQGLLRHRQTLTSPQTPQIRVAGKPYLTFSSNDYLGLANHPQLIAAWQAGAAQWGVGAGAAHLVTGHSAAHEELEQALAQFVGKPAALLFSTGYMANAGTVQGLVGKADFVFADKLNHASLNEAMRLSRATVKRYRHNDVSHLTKLLADAPHGRKLVITDAVFSMDGDIAPLPALLAACEQHDAWLLVDDAHGFGILGAQGRGALAHFGLVSPRIIYMATLGKAAGVFGAFVAAEPIVIDTLINHAPSYIYTTATPPAVAHTTLASLRLLASSDDRRAHLQQLIALLRHELQDLPWTLLPSTTPIQPLLVADAHAALTLSSKLRTLGIWLTAIRPPTVPTARLRITLSATHTTTDVMRLGQALRSKS